MRLLKISNDLRQVLGSLVSDITGEKCKCFISNQTGMWCVACKLRGYCSHHSTDNCYIAPASYCIIGKYMSYMICLDFNLRYTI
jgi:hypothetical protein